MLEKRVKKKKEKGKAKESLFVVLDEKISDANRLKYDYREYLIDMMTQPEY